ncbi:centromere protein C isoform X2 [Microtus pennsylvanicus]|uniref:centromere protein C isoform X2 n=1 Tax=Microtus pennsylvanicus TaxID=10058 RepID=UPI003F6AC37E
MAFFHLDHLKNYHRRFCRPSRAPNIHGKQGQNVLEVLQDCFDEQSSTESLLSFTPKVKDARSQSAGKECQASHSQSVPVSSGRKDASPQVTAEPSEATLGSVQANEVHQKILTISDVSESPANSNNMSSKKTNGSSSATKDHLYLPGCSPVVPLYEKMSESQNVISSLSQKRGAYNSRNSIDTKSSYTDISLKTRKRLNFEDKDSLNKAKVENNVLEVSEGQERTSSETSQKRAQDLTYEIQPQSRKSFSTLYLETVKRKSESSSSVRHTAAISPHSSPKARTLLEDEFIIEESGRSFESQPWVKIPRKDRHQSHHLPSPENIVAAKDKKPGEKPHSVPATSLIHDTQFHKASPIETSQPSVEKILGTSYIDELESDYSSTENNIHSENAKKTSESKRTRRQKKQRVSKPKVVEEQLDMGQGKKKKRNMSNTDKLQLNSKRNMEDCEGARNKPIPNKQISPVGSVDRSFSRESKLSVVRHNGKRRTRKSRLSKNTGKKPSPSKRRKTESSSRVQKTLNTKGSRRSVSHDEISGSQSEPLENEADPTQKKSLDISGPTGGSKYQNSVMTSQNVHLKSHTGEYTRKSSMKSNSNAGEPKNSIWEESGPSRFKDHVMSKSNNSDMGDEKDQESSDLRRRSSNVLPDSNIHHKLVLPSNSPNVRRTKRIRLKPLEYWRGERIDYQERPSGRVVIGIVSPPPVSPIKRAKRNLDKVNKKANKKRIHRDNHEKDRLVVNLDKPLGNPFEATLAKDPETREIVPMDLIRPRDTYQFFVEQHGLKVFKTLDTAVFSTGKLILGPYEEKGKQHVGQDILVFYVNFGDLLCTLHETAYMISTGDSFYVPSGNHYNIKNLLNVESCLLFTQIKR